MENVSTHGDAHAVRTLRTPHARYAARQIADEHADLGIKEVTVRTRWFAWVCKVAPSPLLKDRQGFTELGRELFADFAQKVKREGQAAEQWVVDAKTRYASEWASVGVIEGELMPPEVGGALAAMQSKTGSLQEKLALEMEQLQSFCRQASGVSADFSRAELDLFKARGAVRGMERFKVETLTELETYNQLRHQYVEGQG